MTNLILFPVLVSLVISAAVRLVGMVFSSRIRDLVVRHPVAHGVWFVASSAAFLFLFYFWFLPMWKLPPGHRQSANKAVSGKGARVLLLRVEHLQRALPERQR